MLDSGSSGPIYRDAHGRWFHDGELITNEKIAHAFDRWVDITDDGRFCLRNDVNWVHVEIHGAPVFARRAYLEDNELRLKLSDDTSETLDLNTLRQDRDGRLYCNVRQGRLTCAFDRQAIFDLADLLEEDPEGVVLCVGEVRLTPPLVENPLDPEFRGD